MKKIERYIIFWFSQAVSQMGSNMTGTALTLWTYTQTESAFALSMMTFCNFVPYIVISLFAGGFVDRHNKKRIMIVTDTIAALCSVVILIASTTGTMQTWYLYIINTIIGATTAYAQPASQVAIGRIVPKDHIGRVSGLNSFSCNLIMVCGPVIAASLYAIGGLPLILTIDFATFLFAVGVLAFAIKIPESMSEGTGSSRIFDGCREGFTFLSQHKGLWYIIITMAVINFFSRLTYENILSPMILARSGNNAYIFAIVNAAVGIGGIVGGIIVSAGKGTKNPVRAIYLSAMLSFLFGDLLMAVGRNVIWWSIAGIAASLPIPFIMAGQNILLYSKIPDEQRGRVFAVRNAFQYGMIPLAIVLGGVLAQYVFEPLMANGGSVANAIALLVGNGKGSGMAAMFLCTGISGSLFSGWVSQRKVLKQLGQESITDQNTHHPNNTSEKTDVLE